MPGRVSHSSIIVGMLGLLILAGGVRSTVAQRPRQPLKRPAARQTAESRSTEPQWLDPDREAPLRSQYHVFHSDILDQDASCLVWLPVAYSRAPNRRFPVIYWLHGADGSQRKCAETFLPSYVEALKNRTAPPAIVVAVNGIPRSFYGDAFDGTCPVESVIIKDLIPNIDREFRTLATREGRLIEGFSMGGLGAARLGLKYPDVFGAIAINSAGPLPQEKEPARLPPVLQRVFGDNLDELPHRLAARNAEALQHDTLIRIVCGGDDSLLAGNRILHEVLEDLKIPHVFREVPGVEHEGRKLYERGGNRAFAFHQRAFGDRRAAADD